MDAFQSMGESRQRRKLPPKELDHIAIKQSENGGHVVTHHFTSYEHKPEEYVFAGGDGTKLVQHLKKAAGVKLTDSSND